MISNERSWPNRGRPQHRPFSSSASASAQAHPRPASREDLLKSGELLVERKNFFIMLKENSRGRFLRITEDTSGRTNSIIIPDSGFGEFLRVLDEMIKTDSETAAPQTSPAK